MAIGVTFFTLAMALTQLYEFNCYYGYGSTGGPYAGNCHNNDISLQ